MKSANQTYSDNKVRTEITCNDCGNRTYVNSGINTKTVKKALSRPCRSCNPPNFPLINVGWWKGFGLDLNLMYMVLCHVLGLVRITEWKKQDVWDGWHGLGKMNTCKNVKELLCIPKKNKIFF